MQKIKYPVGSKLKNKRGYIFVISDILPSGFSCILIEEKNNEFTELFNQKQNTINYMLKQGFKDPEEDL